jgi:DNA-binding CsgD family transcriptional regulator
LSGAEHLKWRAAASPGPHSYEETIHIFFFAPIKHKGMSAMQTIECLHWGCGCSALGDEPRGKLILCENHARDPIASATPVLMPLSALRSIDRKRADGAEHFILVDRFMQLAGDNAGAQTAEFLPYVLAALAPYANRDVPGLIEIGGGCSLRIVSLFDDSTPAAMIVFVKTSALSAALRRATQLYGLTRREVEVLSLLTEAYSNEEIATELSVAVSTVSEHLQNLSRKMGCLRRSQIVRKLFVY